MRTTVRILIAALALAPLGCSFYYSSESSGKTLTSPQAVYSGLVHQREELRDQMEKLREERGNVGTWLRNDGMDQTDKVGLQQRKTPHYRMPILEEAGGWMRLNKYQGPEIPASEWESLTYTTYSSDPTTYFAPTS